MSSKWQGQREVSADKTYGYDASAKVETGGSAEQGQWAHTTQETSETVSTRQQVDTHSWKLSHLHMSTMEDEHTK